MAKELAIPDSGSTAEPAHRLLRKDRRLSQGCSRRNAQGGTPHPKAEVRATTTVVIVTVFAFAAYFYVVDNVLGRTVQAVLRSLGGAQ